MAKPKMTLREYCEQNPDRAYLLDEWDYEANGEMTPDSVGYGSTIQISWKLPYDDAITGKHFDFTWKASPNARTKGGTGCPYLSSQAVWVGFNDLKTIKPKIATQWHPTKNGDLTPVDVTANTNKKAWWIYSYDVPKDYPIEHLRGKHFNFEWESAISSRTDALECPFLSGKSVWPGFNDLATTHPEIAKQWHPFKNAGLKNKVGISIATPQDVIAGSKQKVWWYLPYDVPDDYPVENLRGKHFDFEWETSIRNRTVNDCDCPFLTSTSVWIGFNDLATVNPELAKQWHPIRNIGLQDNRGRDVSEANKVTANSSQNVWWYLPYVVPEDYPVVHLRGKSFVFEWQSTVASRTYGGHGCPYLSNTNPKTWKGFNDLETTHPDLAAQWHPTKNGSLTPSDVSRGSVKRVWWLMPYDVPDDYPIEHLRGKHFDFEWDVTVNSRTSMDLGCPFLTRHRTWTGFNDLATTHPYLIKEWNSEKNKDISPEKISYGSTKKVWWKCKEGHEWMATPNDRTNSKTHCPICAESYGAAAVRKILKEMNISFKEEHSFPDRKYINPLRDDFALFDTNGKVVATIEYHGEQHYKAVRWGHMTQSEAEDLFKLGKLRDQIKSDYLKAHGIPQLIIPYWDFDKIEDIVTRFLKTIIKEDAFAA